MQEGPGQIGDDATGSANIGVQQGTLGQRGRFLPVAVGVLPNADVRGFRQHWAAFDGPAWHGLLQHGQQLLRLYQAQAGAQTGQADIVSGVGCHRPLPPWQYAAQANFDDTIALPAGSMRTRIASPATIMRAVVSLITTGMMLMPRT